MPQLKALRRPHRRRRRNRRVWARLVRRSRRDKQDGWPGCRHDDLPDLLNALLQRSRFPSHVPDQGYVAEDALRSCEPLKVAGAEA